MATEPTQLASSSLQNSLSFLVITWFLLIANHHLGIGIDYLGKLAYLLSENVSFAEFVLGLCFGFL